MNWERFTDRNVPGWIRIPVREWRSIVLEARIVNHREAQSSWKASCKSCWTGWMVRWSKCDKRGHLRLVQAMLGQCVKGLKSRVVPRMLGVFEGWSLVVGHRDHARKDMVRSWPLPHSIYHSHPQVIHPWIFIWSELRHSWEYSF